MLLDLKAGSHRDENKKKSGGSRANMFILICHHPDPSPPRTPAPSSMPTSTASKTKRLEDAKAASAKLLKDPKATMAQKLAAASAEAAAEGELVTGLKPIKLGRGGGRGRGGTWRGRSRGGGRGGGRAGGKR